MALILQSTIFVLPFIVAILYILTAVAHAFRGEFAWTFTWICYALANIGLILASNKIL